MEPCFCYIVKFIILSEPVLVPQYSAVWISLFLDSEFVVLASVDQGNCCVLSCKVKG